jgi:hypothetical protein
VEVDAQEPEASIALLRTLPQVSSVTQLGDRVHVLLSGDAAPAEEVAPVLEQHLRSEGHDGVVAMAAQPNLEDVFVALNLGEKLIEEAR